ncbi:hypothetical protein D187_001592 [Cystobacter fuscus DSM 2262]|uniref:Uncharacterized protein n=1 Tax=Cystobacter fuscus (strain ATCC 25194 / DSM 2262 / NBRC 100088 / M29) TaxID=1242864 RepID=S9P931_CYSF2|nr:hypothetical protein [Cystobacter fuscus]EPX60940.1 hypothetical protein D187_001592 [Cystobacter fuscus DSM 2262]
MISGAEFDAIPHPRWRVHLCADIFLSLSEGVPKEQRQRMEESFESFYLRTPWGALYHAVSPPSPRSAERMARWLAAMLRFWDVLQGPRYAYRMPDTHHTLDELMDYRI